MDGIDHVASDDNKRLWKIELQISNVLLDVCNRFNLKIWACYGTLLGAVRHSGFIPWDDDMDFVMMRDDYDKLLELIIFHSSELSLPDNFEFDIRNIRAIKLKRKDTTMMPPRWKYSKNNNYGVWVDIICLDIAPDNLTPLLHEYESLKTKIRIYLNGELSYYAYLHVMSYWFIHFCCRWYLIIKSSSCFRKQIENHMRKGACRFSGEKVWGYMLWSTMGEINKVRIYDKKWFDDTVFLPFEDTVLPCPKEWDKVLTAQYGDWRTPVMGASQHEGTYVNVDQPYREYVENFLMRMPWWKRYWYKH